MPDEALVTSPFGVGAVITSLIALSFWLDRRFRMFSWLGTAILVITGGAVLVNIGVIPPSIGVEELNPIYTFAGEYGIPIAIVLLLLSADLRNLPKVGKPALIAFILGALGTAAGALLGVWLTAGGIGPEAWKIGGQFTASYMGGGVNYAAVGSSLETSETMFATGAAADNIMTNIWMIMTAVIPVLLRRYYPRMRTRASGGEPGGAFWKRKEVSIYDLTTLAATVFVIIAVSDSAAPVINAAVGFDIPPILWYTTLALLVAVLTPANRLRGGEDLGNFILHFFFATMGAGTVLSTLVDKGPTVFLFLCVLVGVHALILFGLGRWFKVEVEMLAVASQACVGGPSTALALASSRRWFSLVTPAVLLGVLGYAVGNYAGIGMAQWMRWMLGAG
ncbi:DUF819 family protein [Paludifilum halophilum]|uniref:DUF819 domain-containing protein n=1 Tax=Paludifilum halophilum TaxID=1642702 RepID=A0A235BB58_9BACL|nr:DUF819 family protein [Paludifilum halophilum]OYD09452.1 hypothetical protein CHM34_00020 [Paludifilum halophilum]